MPRKRKSPVRICSVCGKKYFRRNLLESWVSQNPGKRKGWEKEVFKVCTNCAGEKQSQKIVYLATAEFEK